MTRVDKSTNWLQKNKQLLIVIGLALVVRIIYLIELSNHPGFTVPMVDEKWHWLWAHDILKNSFWGDTAWFRAPLYPYFLAFLSAITGGSIFFSKFLQLLVTGGSAFFIYRIAHHLFGNREAFIAGIMYACYGTLVFYETMFLIPVVFLFFTLWGVYRLIISTSETTLTQWLLTGLIFGLSAISRPNILLVIPLLLLWIFFFLLRTSDIKRRIVAPILVAVGVALVILPVTVRNYLVTGEFILISSQGGVNLYIGNNDAANGLSMHMPEVELNESLSWSQFIPTTTAVAEREAGRELGDAEVSAFWTTKAINWITANPSKFIGLLWRKSVYLLSGFENSDNSDIYFERGKSFLFSILLWDFGLKFPFGLLLPLALVGLYLLRSQTRKLSLLYLFILGYIPTIILFLVTARHRLSLIPFLIIIASATIVKLYDIIRNRNHSGLAIPLVILSLSLVVFNQNYYDEGGSNDFQIYFNEGIKAQNQEDWITAEENYAKADQLSPFSASLKTNLGWAQYKQGKIDQAKANYYSSLEINPAFHKALNNLAIIVHEEGLLDSAIILYGKAIDGFDSLTARQSELSQIFMNLASVFEDANELDLAAQAFESSILTDSSNGLNYFIAAAFYARHGQHERADQLWSAGTRKHEMGAVDYFNWGLSLMERKQLTDGVKMMKRALKRDATLYQAYFAIGVGFLEGGISPDTVQMYIDKCLEINPDYEPALQLQENLKKMR